MELVVAIMATIDSLADDLRALGVRPDQDIIVHSSLRHVRYGPEAVLAALRETAGTIVVPAQTPQSSVTSRAFAEATMGLDARQTTDFRARLPGFDQRKSPSLGMGALAEYVRTRPGAFRSGHPLTSFAAIGPRAEACTARHDLDSLLGERSPLGWLYERDAAVLLLGVGYSVCTAFHLAEYRIPTRWREYRCLVSDGDVRRELRFHGIVLDDTDFSRLGAHIDDEPFVRRGRVGAAHSRLLPVRAAVDAAYAWMREHRTVPGTAATEQPLAPRPWEGH
jgi:aminoglycoside 3-N-acetyltransferase